MKTKQTQGIDEVRTHLIEVIGRTTEDLGLGRIVGQVLAHIYLSDHDCSLDELGDELGLSKASVSIAARQIESMGLIHKSWKRGDRRHYYRLVKDLGVAVRKGLLAMVRSKLDAVGSELDYADALMQTVDRDPLDRDAEFVRQRLHRAQRLRKRMGEVLGSPILRLLER